MNLNLTSPSHSENATAELSKLRGNELVKFFVEFESYDKKSDPFYFTNFTLIVLIHSIAGHWHLLYK